MDVAVRNMAAWGRVSLPDALTMASTIPARLLGLNDFGTLTPTAAADLVVLDPDLHVAETWIAGEMVFSRT
jgi:N-acetylglucosamine-6-phosphate deacetylase